VRGEREESGRVTARVRQQVSTLRTAGGQRRPLEAPCPYEIDRCLNVDSYNNREWIRRSKGLEDTEGLPKTAAGCPAHSWRGRNAAFLVWGLSTGDISATC
jgi:hypothetical protein